MEKLYIIQPIKPSDVTSKKPGAVILVFNELIEKYWDGTLSTVQEKEAAEMIAIRLNINTKEVYKNRYLDIEDLYREAGWDVYYSKPAYNEDYYPPYFVFSC